MIILAFFVLWTQAERVLFYSACVLLSPSWFLPSFTALLTGVVNVNLVSNGGWAVLRWKRLDGGGWARGWVVPPQELGEDCVQRSASSGCNLHVSPPPASLCEKAGMEDAVHQKGLLVCNGKKSFENSQSGDAFIVCLGSSQATTEMKKTYSFSA